MRHANDPFPRGFASEQRRRAPRRRARIQREPLSERAAAREEFEQRRDLPCVRLDQRPHCLLQQRPSE